MSSLSFANRNNVPAADGVQPKSELQRQSFPHTVPHGCHKTNMAKVITPLAIFNNTSPPVLMQNIHARRSMIAFCNGSVSPLLPAQEEKVLQVLEF
jgi:hypothetical protein